MISLLISSCVAAEEALQAETSHSRSYKISFVPWECSRLRCGEGTGAKQASGEMPGLVTVQWLQYVPTKCASVHLIYVRGVDAS